MTSLLESSVSELNSLDTLSIEVIKVLYPFLDLGKFSKTTPINDIIESIEVVPWDPHIISKRKDIPLEYVEILEKKFPEIKWNKKNATLATFIILPSQEPYVDDDTIEHIIENMIPESLFSVINNNKTSFTKKSKIITKITLKLKNTSEYIIEKAIYTIPEYIDFNLLTHFVTWRFIILHINHNWNLYEKDIELYENNDNTRCSFISISMLDTLNNKNINWTKITENISYIAISLNQHLPWDMNTLIYKYYNKKFDLDFILCTPLLNWDNQKITEYSDWGIINNHPFFDWDPTIIGTKEVIDFGSSLPNPNIEIVKKYHPFLNISELTSHYPINGIQDTIHIIPWDTNILLTRENVPFDIFIKYPRLPWIKENILYSNNTEKRMIIMKFYIDKLNFAQDIKTILYKKILDL